MRHEEWRKTIWVYIYMLYILIIFFILYNELSYASDFRFPMPLRKAWAPGRSDCSLRGRKWRVMTIILLTAFYFPPFFFVPWNSIDSQFENRVFIQESKYITKTVHRESQYFCGAVRCFQIDIRMTMMTRPKLFSMVNVEQWKLIYVTVMTMIKLMKQSLSDDVHITHYKIDKNGTWNTLLHYVSGYHIRLNIENTNI